MLMEKVFPTYYKWNSINGLIHQISSKTNFSGKVLIIAGYDYFLNKQDFRELLNIYTKLILIPRVEDYQSVTSSLLSSFQCVDLIVNTNYDDLHSAVYELVIRENKQIAILNVEDFCEKVLQKIYVASSLDDNYSNTNSTNYVYFNIYIRFFKKMIDLTSSLVLIVLSFPLWLYSSYKIRKESPGPIFFGQKRVGIREKEFLCLKFRSMRIDAERNGAQFSSKKDDRIFNYGRTMRATRIDELPQLLNIFKGEMSMVGPRPERKVFTDSFAEEIPLYHKRHVVKQGITGYAQVMYPYGAGLNDARHKLMYDLYYVKNWTIALELKIIFKTIYIVLTKKGI